MVKNANGGEELSERQKRLLELMLEEKRKKQGTASQQPPAASGLPSISPRPGEDPAPLSFAQQRLWFIEQLQPETAAYNIPAGVRLRGPMQVALFAQALKLTARRHDTLRTTFELRSGRPAQIVAEEPEATLPVVDLQGLGGRIGEDEAQRVVDRIARRPFSLSDSPPWRALLVRVAEDDHVFMTVMHHIISDTWTTGVFFREMVGHYKALLEGGEAVVPELPVQYGDYAAWQRRELEGGSLEQQLEYWVEHFEGAPSLLALPLDRPRPAVQTFRGGRITLVLPKSLTDRLKELSGRQEATFFMTLMAAYQTLLFRYTGERDVLVGTPMANRDRVELENLIGLFVNTLVLRTGFQGDPSFRALLNQVRATTLEGLSHHDVPFERVVEELSLERDTSRNPLFQVLFAFQNVPIPKLVAEGLTLERFEFQETTARLELELDLQEMPYGFVGWLGYNADLFDGATVERMARNFRVLLEAVAEDPDVGVDALPLLTEEERDEVLWGENRTAESFDEEITIHARFEAQVDRDPEAVAVVSGGETTTYGELEARANQLAHLLQKSGVAEGSPVGIYLRRGLDTVASVLAVLKAGGTYVPLDLTFPEERMETILVSAGSRHVLTQRGLLEDMGQAATARDHVILVDGEAESSGAGDGPRFWGAADLASQPTSRPTSTVTADSWAYTIFTSGSTGTPKGVMVQHRPVSNLIEWVLGRFRLGADDQVLFITSLSFDLSVFDVFGMLAAGGSIRVATDEEKMDPHALLEILRTEPVTFWDSAPAALQQLAGIFPEETFADSALRLVFLSGDWIPVALPDQVREVFPRAQVISLGGATEATVWSNFFPVEEVPSWWTSIPYGKPIQNARYHALDSGLRPQPTNVPGDLFIGGDCLSFGYLASPALTAWKYIPDPYAEEAGARLYRTGDRVRRWKDGNLEFLGRLDHQVKVRGYRIELGEIASALADHPEVKDAVVLVREDVPGDQRLVAYAVPEGDELPPPVELRTSLRRRLPEYMVPAVFMEIEGVPVTSNGKLDRAALPVPEVARPEMEQAYEDPESEAERTIAELWTSVLQVDRVGRHDNFFELGGHSLLLTQIHGDLQERLSADLTLVDLFTYPTVASLAEHLTRAKDAQEEVVASLSRAAARKDAAAEISDEAVAIVGIALRYPQARDVEEFWQNLRTGTECIEFFTEEEVLAAGVDPEMVKHPDYVRAEGTVADVDKFDWRFFGYGTKEEVELIDPQQRIFMEIAWECFERAGYNPFSAEESIGVFGGVNISSYMFNSLYDYDPYNVMSSFLTRIGLLVGNQNDYLCTRIAYHFNLRGPALTVQTACSTATVATHLASQSLLRRECDMALAGGVQIRVPQNMGYLYQEGGFPSPDGHCRSFDAKAKGNVHGNGAGVLLLKRLSDAVRDGDHVHAVIRGSAVANDGSVKVGFTAPGVSGQARVAAEAMAVAGVEPHEIGYLEATGTGTELGDPIEIESLTKAYRLGTQERGYCPIGSVKSNIGHTDAASGAAALIKGALTLEREEIPPSLHFEEPNPRIDFENSPFFVNTELRPFPRNGKVRRTAVHTYAVGGTNTHVILEEAPLPQPSGPSRPWQLLPISARSSTALSRATENLAAYLAQASPGPEELADVAYTLQVGRRAFPVRRAVLTDGGEDAVTVLRSLDPRRVVTESEAGEAPRLAFLLTEPEDLDPAAVAELAEAEMAFAEALREADALLAPQLGRSVAELLTARGADLEKARETLRRDRFQGPAAFAVLYALGKLVQGWGAVPRRLLGTGVGEIVAACFAGALPLETAARLAVERGKVLEASPRGSLIEVFAPAHEVAESLSGDLRLSSVGPGDLCQVRGPREAVEALASELEDQGVDAFVLGETACPPDPGAEALAELREVTAGLEPAPPEIRWLSTTDREATASGQGVDPAHWESQISAPLRLEECLGEVATDEAMVLLEVTTRPRWTSEVSGWSGSQARCVAALGGAEEDLPVQARLLRSLGELWTLGVEVDWKDFSAHEKRRRRPLPTYPFERERIWAEPDVDRSEAMDRLGGPKKKKGRLPLEEWAYVPSWVRREAPQPEASQAGTGLWLVFAEPGSVADEAALCRQAEGGEVVCVRQGEAFAAPSEGVAVVRPDAPEDYRQLLESLDGETVARVVFGWTAGEGNGAEGEAEAGTGLDPLDPASAPGFWPLVLLARALGSRRDEAALTVLTSGALEVMGNEALEPARSLVLGVTKTVPQEYPHLRCTVVDLPEEDDASAPGEPGTPRKTTRALLRELRGGGEDPVVAVRGSRRWVQTFEPTPLPEVSAVGLPEKAVVLVTGGVHPFTLTAAEALAEEGPRRIAFLGDSGLPPREEWQRWREEHGDDDETSRRLARLEALEAAGSEVRIQPADLSSASQVTAAVAAVKEEWGEIHGVVFTSGELAPEFVRGLGELDEEFVRYRLQQRLRALLTLDSLLAGEPLAFFVLSSTVASVLGGLAVSVEGAADVFLDTFAQLRRQQGRPYLSIDWDALRFGHEDAETAARLPKEALRPEEMAEVLRRLAAGFDGGQVVVSTTDLEARLRPVSATAEAGAGVGRERPADLPQEYVAPRNEVEEEVARIWAEVLGLNRVGADDNYFDLGGNSLLATQLVSRLRGRFEVDLALQGFFEGATVAHVARSIDMARWASEGPAEGGEPVMAGAEEEIGEI